MKSESSNGSLERYGFRQERGSAHMARTMMLPELHHLLDSVPVASPSSAAYTQAIEEGNCLGKRSYRTRVLTRRHLVDLYTLNPDATLFRTLRYFWQRDPDGRPLIAALCVFARDPLFKVSSPFVLKLTDGQIFSREALEEYLEKMYPGRFSKATLLSTAQNLASSWTQTGHLSGRVKKVRTRAKATTDSPDGLKAVGDDGEPAKNPVCKAILAFIAGGKKGADMRDNFEASPYGCSRDAIDGGLQVLLVAGLIRAQNGRGRAVDPKDLERKAIGKATFKVESATVSTSQRIQIRKTIQRLGVHAKQSEELAAIPEFLRLAGELADKAGGEAPMPECPDVASLEEIRLSSGNEQLLSIYNRRDELKTAIDTWEDQAKRIEKRWSTWEKLRDLLKHAGDLKAAQEARQQAEAIEKQRLLLAEPNPIQPLLKSLEDALRTELASQQKRHAEELKGRTSALENDASWKQLAEDERDSIRGQCGIADAPKLSLETHQELVCALEQHPLVVWRDRIDALPGRFDRARELAANSLEPETQTVTLPRRTLRTTTEVDVWVEEVWGQLRDAVAKGPIIV